MTFPAIVLCVVVTLFASSHQHETSSQALLSCEYTKPPVGLFRPLSQCDRIYQYSRLFVFVPGKSPSLDFIPRDWITMADPCTEMMKKQVNVELSASMTYFAMVRRPVLYPKTITLHHVVLLYTTVCALRKNFLSPSFKNTSLSIALRFTT